MCIGGMLMFGSVIAFAMNSTIGCNVFVWMLPIGFALLFGYVPANCQSQHD
jgi:TRAP-type C4-dicarboxylate transport system permease small subunit